MRALIVLFVLIINFASSLSAQNASWSKVDRTDGGFLYYTNSSEDFEVNSYDEHSFSERGPIVVYFKSWVSENAEYLVRYAKSPPGITYLNEPEDLETHLNQLIAKYDATLIDKKSFVLNGFNTMDASFTNAEYLIYIRSIIRGNQLVLLFQAVKADSGEARFEDFFKNFEFYVPENLGHKPYELSDSKMTLDVPEKKFAQTEELEKGTVAKISFSDSKFGATIDVDVTKLDPYSNYLFDKNTFVYEKLVQTEEVDSLLMFTTGKIQEVCPMYRLEHFKTENQKFISEIYIYCNGYKHDITMSIPLAYRNLGYSDKIFKSIHFDLDASANTWMLAVNKNINTLILNDLMSEDSIKYNQALEKIYEYDGFGTDDIPQIIKVLSTPSKFDSDEYNAKYYLVTTLHDLKDDRIEASYEKIYTLSDNIEFRSRILESLSIRNQAKSKELFLKLLSSSAPETYTLKDDAFDAFADSLALFEAHKDAILGLASKNIARDKILDTYSAAVGYFGKDNALAKDSTSVDKMILADLASWKKEILQDDSSPIPMHVANYYVVFENKVQEEEIFELLNESTSIFNWYRSVYNKLSQNLVPSEAELDRIFSENYYWYFILQTLARKQMTDKIAERFLKLEKNVEAVMHNYYYENFNVDCKKFEIKDQVQTKFGKMVYCACKDDDQDGAYYGIIGPIDPKGIMDFANDQSVYYQEKQYITDDKERLQYLINYLDEK